jgi:hypothetical protein
MPDACFAATYLTFGDERTRAQERSRRLGQGSEGGGIQRQLPTIYRRSADAQGVVEGRFACGAVTDIQRAPDAVRWSVHLVP